MVPCDVCRPALPVAWQRVLNGPPSNPNRLLLQTPRALGYTNRISSTLNITNSSVTLNSNVSATLSPEPIPGISASTAASAPSLLEWNGHVHIADVRWVSKGVHRIEVRALTADSSTLTWGNMTFVTGMFSLTDCKVSDQVTVDEQASLFARNSKFDREVQVKGRVGNCRVKTQEGIGCAQATACNDQQSLQCWCPHGEKGEYRGKTCETQSATCRPGWQLAAEIGIEKNADEEPCVPCDGTQDRYSLNNQCRVCPEGFDCKEGYFRVRPKENGFWMGHPYYMSCVSNSTLETLAARGANISAYIAIAEGDRNQQEYMGVSHDLFEKWKCGENSTMISSPAPSAGSAQVYPCPNPDACIVRDDGTADCDKGYKGPLCGMCEDGFVWSEGHICKSCEGDTYAWRVGAAVVAGIAIVVLMYAFLAHPAFETDGQGPFQRFVACAPQCRAHAEFANETSEDAHGLCEAFAAYKEQIDGIMEFGDEEQGAWVRCLVGFTQVNSPSCSLRRKGSKPLLVHAHIPDAKASAVCYVMAGHWQCRGDKNWLARSVHEGFQGVQGHQSLV
jgi:hypothetical protein